MSHHRSPLATIPRSDMYVAQITAGKHTYVPDITWCKHTPITYVPQITAGKHTPISHVLQITCGSKHTPITNLCPTDHTTRRASWICRHLIHVCPTCETMYSSQKPEPSEPQPRVPQRNQHVLPFLGFCSPLTEIISVPGPRSFQGPLWP